jgi:hypothetical protein
VTPPAAPDPELSTRALDLAEFGAKFAIALGGIYALVEKVAKPYYEWRKKRLALELKELLAPELERLEMLGATAIEIRTVLARQTEIFQDFDAFMVVARDHTDRLDETNDLLDEVFHLDRRFNSERRAEIDTLLSLLDKRQKARRRHEESTDVTPPSEPDA